MKLRLSAGFRALVFLALAGVFFSRSWAGVSVTQNVSPGATSWPGSPIASTVTNPGALNPFGTIESFNGGGGNTNLSQTFTITTTNYTLQTIDLYVTGGTGTDGSTNIVLNLYDLGSQTAPNPGSYSGGANLFGGGAGLSINYFSQSPAILKLDFDGADQVTLQNGHMYAFEITGLLGTQPMFWYRGTNETYTGGAAYRNRSWINGINARDFALAVYGSVSGVIISNPAVSAGATIEWNNVRQQIDGFGASSAWRSTWTTSLANMLFGTNSGTGTAKNGSTYSYNGVGLSLLRTRIAPGGTTVENSLMQMAQNLGARVWSAPWSPQTSFKTVNQNGVISLNGGGFDGSPANYQAYANQLTSYVVKMKNIYGVNLYALSVQNEPDHNDTNYESCVWTGTQIHDFVPYLSAALAASNVAATKIVLPESQNWASNPGLWTPTMNDGAVAPLVSIIANHNYVGNNAVGDQTTPAAITNYGKPTWETEVSKLSGNDITISDGLYWAGRVHLFLTAAQANAWHYWWLCSGSTTTGNEGLCDTNDVPAKRMYTLGNFSRFVRPGDSRIVVSSNTGPLQISAYKNPTNGSFAIVAINSTSSNVVQTFSLNGFLVGSSVTPWLTSASASLSAQPSFAVTNAVFSNTIPAMSVVTLTGQASSNHPPALAATANQFIDPGISLTLTNVATDTDAPPQTLTFTLLTAPANASLNPSNGVLTWRPLVSQANSTNPISLKVADNGAPSLSATSSFSITVNPLNPPTIDSINSSGGLVNLSVSGALGPDYTLLTSTNLLDWQTLITTNPTAMPLLLQDTNTSDAARFYRFQLGP